MTDIYDAISEQEINNFRPQEINANRHSPRGEGMLEESLQKVGWIGAATCAADGEMFDGSLRLEKIATVFDGVKPIVVDTDGTRPVILRRTDIATANDPKARLASVYANRVAEVSLNWDTEVLEEWNSEGAIDIDTMWFPEEMAEWNVEEEQLPTEEEDETTTVDLIDRTEQGEIEPRCKVGEIWALGRHRLACGDSGADGAIARLLNGNKIDLVFTDPPYGVDVGGKNALLNKFDKSSRVDSGIVDDDIPIDDLGAKLVKVFKAIKSQSQDHCSYYVCFATCPPLMSMVVAMMGESGLQTKHLILWDKLQPTFSMGRLDYEYQHEGILYTWNKKHIFYGEGQFKTTIWPVKKPLASSSHPTMKPVELVDNAILNSSKKGDIVFDAFLGSGTTLLSAEKNDRICYGLEITPKYTEVILRRWEEYTGGVAELAGHL
jgi:site-specific DNA-methyltransferase (adenine-specific)